MGTLATVAVVVPGAALLALSAGLAFRQFEGPCSRGMVLQPNPHPAFLTALRHEETGCVTVIEQNGVWHPIGCDAEYAGNLRLSDGGVATFQVRQDPASYEHPLIRWAPEICRETGR